MASNDANLDAELRTLLAENRKIEAIKRYREATGAGLAAAKEAVEALERGESPPRTKPADSALEAETVSLLKGGKKIKAVKLNRERTGTGLKEAKGAVESIAADRHIMPSRSECLGVVFLVTLISIVAIRRLHGVVWPYILTPSASPLNRGAFAQTNPCDCDFRAMSHPGVVVAGGCSISDVGEIGGHVSILRRSFGGGAAGSEGLLVWLAGVDCPVGRAIELGDLGHPRAMAADVVQIAAAPRCAR
jgi:ribosomal protein L7/L12